MILIGSALIALAMADGCCSGIRDSFGRTGLIRHRPLAQRGAVIGATLATVALVPSALVVWADLTTDASATSAYLRAGRVLLAFLVPFALVVLAALAAYASLGWRRKYLAMALVLGPCTFARPLVAVVAASAGAAASGRSETIAAIAVAAIGLLAIEPLMGVRWRTARWGYAA